MLAMLGKLIAWLFGLLANAKAPPPAERAAAAETKLATKEATDAQVESAIAASRAARERIVREPESIRAPDKFSRD